MAMTPLTGMPARTQEQSTFNTNANDFFSTKLPLFVTEANALQVDVDAKKTLAETAATTATTQAGTATTQAGIATTQAGLALGYKDDAAASAASAVLSPGSQATSASSISVGTGSKSLTLAQTGKNFVVGQFVSITRTSDPAGVWMNGAITAFTAGTGVMTVDVVNAYGAAGPYTDWTISQSAPVAPNTVAIGALRFSQDVGTIISPIGSDPATYLRTGTVATAATYPAGALVDYLKAYGSANVSLGQYIGDVATDGNQTIVCTYNNANVLVSTNGGASWSTVASNLGASALASGVCWTGSRFILAGHSGGSGVYLSYSATGSSFTAGASISLGGTAAGPVSIRWDGTVAMLAVRNGTAGCVATTADGTSTTPRSLPAAIGSDPRVAVVAANGATRWLISLAGSDTSYRSAAADGSGTWTFQTGPNVGGAKSVVATSSKFIVGNGTNIYYSSTGATGSWTTVALPSISTFVGSLNVNSNCNLHFDGTRLWIGASLGTSATVYANASVYTTDLTTFATWTQVQATYPIAGQATYGANIAPLTCGTRLLFLPADGLSSGNGSGHAATVSASYSANWAAGADYVGHSLPVTLNSDGAYASTRFVGYVRVA